MRTIALVGAPGAGKSTVGRLLAERLNLDFIDVDAVIEQRVAKPISAIFAEDGEATFRELEEQVTLELLGAEAVIALGGGAVLSERIRQALENIFTVWLEVSIGKASSRVGLNQTRPLLMGNVRARLIELLRARTPLYEQVSKLRITTDDLSPAQVVSAIEGSLQ